MNFISVNDKLPDHDEFVLALNKNKGMHVCIFILVTEMNKLLKKKGLPEKRLNETDRPYGFCSQEVRGNILNDVTHWMPLPEPPKE
jgi:hypothetical protein